MYTFRSTLSRYFIEETDLVFVLDESGSIGDDNFLVAKKFTELVARFFIISPIKTRIAVVTFDTFAKQRFDYISSGSGDMCNFISNVKAIPYGAQWTNTGDGLRMAGGILRNGRKTSQKVIILLSDGLTSSGPEFIQPAPVAQELRQEGMTIFCVGVAGASEEELLTIANSPSHLYMITDFNYIKLINDRLTADSEGRDQVVQRSRYSCSKVCKAGGDCCDRNADCTCGSDGGFYCSCKPGFTGNGLIGKCTKCPKGFYKASSGDHDCSQCPANSGTSQDGSTSKSDCRCYSGFIGNPSQSIPCRSTSCPKLFPPKWGQTEPKNCGNDFNDRCSFWCENPYCPYNGSIPNCLQQMSRKKQPPRICQVNGQWTGEEFYCEEARCPTLQNPQNGIYHCDSSNFKTKSICTLKCNPGYKIKGGAKKRCQPNSVWTGEDGTCEPVTCPPKGLKVNKLAKIKPEDCKTKQSPYGKKCQYYCTAGYTLIRLPSSVNVDGIPIGLRICGSNRQWEGNGEQYQCKDSTPPVITCPDSQSTIAAPSQRISRKVNWTLPSAVDNDGQTPKIKLIEPTFFKGKPGTKPPAQFFLGKNKLVYKATDRAKLEATCSFTIIVLDKEKPKVAFCPFDIEIFTPLKSTRVTWNEPKFTDNSGDRVTIQQSHKTNDEFSTERLHRVTYKATDSAKNSAVCKFLVKPKGYKCEYRRPPKNGIISCKTITLSRQICTVSCRKGHALLNKPRDDYECKVIGGKATWSTNNLWPDCSAVSKPQITSSVKASLADCNDPKARQKIIEEQKKKLCPNPKICKIKNIDIKCETASTPSRPRGKRDTESTDVLTLEIEIELDTSALNELDSNGGDLSKDFDNFINQTVSSITTDETGQVTATVTQKFDFKCQPGQILIKKFCVNCPVGTFHSGITCKSCPVHTYQDEEAQRFCKSCPPDTYTIQDHSVDNSSCFAPCEPGSFSATGLEQCIACPIGTYQDLPQRTSCKKCPYPNNSTAMEGADSIDDCTMPCSPGAFSSTGFEPCDLCPRGSYQPEFQKTECIPCRGDLWTRESGTTDISSCAYIDICDPNPCQHNGICTADNDEYNCTCVAGYAGTTCDINIDDCAPDLCHNGGTCVDGVNDYQCICPPRYTGLQCEEEIDECLGDVCLNGGTCHKKNNSFTCECKKGFAGIKCEIAFNECEPNPCHNAKCVDKSEGFHCCCPPGYTGDNCLERKNECSPNPCHNNAICRLESKGFVCDCPRGFTGTECEANINDCLGIVCQNNGACVDGINNFTCQCKPGFTGKFCQTSLRIDYEVEFSEGRISNYALLENNVDLYSLTLAFWMKADQDPSQRSTPVSYAYKNKLNGSIESNGLTIYDTRKFIIYLHGSDIRTNVIANSDTNWHHYALTWDSLDGLLMLYKDGKEEFKLIGITPGIPLWRGIFVLGQEQDSLGGAFSATESFVGSLTQFNVWDYAMTSNEIKTLSQRCGYIGNVIAWSNVKDHLVGDDIVIKNAEICQRGNIGLCGQRTAECHCQGNRIPDDFKCEKALTNCQENTCYHNQICITNNIFSYCDCQQGYSGKLCQYDINECLENNGGCSHSCINTIGSYQCSCPDGLALNYDGKTCYATTHCSHKDLLFNDNEQWTENCNECTCIQGIVTCTALKCEAINCPADELAITLPTECCPSCVANNRSHCIIKPDNLYKSFDNHHIKFTSSCRYTLAQDCAGGTINIQVENSASYTSRKNITLMVECDEVHITNEGHLLVNGKPTRIPYSDYKHIRVEHAPLQDKSNQRKLQKLIVTLEEAVLIWSLNGFIEVTISEKLKGKMCGLCGNNNGIKEDDMMLRNYKSATSLSEFINGWRSNIYEDCPTPQYMIQGRPVVLSFPSCTSRPRRWKRAQKACEAFRSKAFHPCYEKLNPQGYYDMCLQDYCMCNSSLCHCDSLFTYEEECRKLGVEIDSWKGQATCNNKCQNGKKFDVCGPACPATCTNEHLSNPHCLFTTCRSGCHCPKGTVLHEDYCILQSECPARG